MKTRSILFFVLGALATLSLSFVTIKSHNKRTDKIVTSKSIQVKVNEPLGGFVSEDKL